jgi:uncharacterized membrane protein
LFITDYISDKEPITNKFISVPKEMGELNCASFVGGIIRGVLDSAEFVHILFICSHPPLPAAALVRLVSFSSDGLFIWQTCTVVTHLVPDPEKAQRMRTVYAVKISEDVMQRDKRLT